MDAAEGWPHAKVVDFCEHFLDVPDLLECADDDNDSDYSYEHDEHSIWSDAPAEP